MRPFLEKFCLDCHSGDQPEAKLDLAVYRRREDVSKAHPIWQIVAERLRANEMPPPKADQPAATERQAALRWIADLRRHDAQKNAGDPGLVLPRRLNNAEYNYSVHDLTGVDIQPTAEFPVDPANEAGFDNSGESLTMSPALLNKYLGAARKVAEHLVLKPDGIAFAPHSVATDTDRDKYCVKRIVQFYNRQPTDLAKYFVAAWRYRTRPANQDRVGLGEFARESGLSLKYLQTVWSALEEPDAAGPLARLQQMWRDLPDRSDSEAAHQGCHRMRQYVSNVRDKLQVRFENLTIEGSHKGSQPFVLWKNRQYAAYRTKYHPRAFENNRLADDPDLAPPQDSKRRAAFEKSLARFCAVFPDAFYVSERGRDYLDELRTEEERGRLLSAGFHSMMGYFRDDQPLYELVLDGRGQRELDSLWKELDFVASAPLRQYSGFLWFERTDSRYMRDPQFDFARAEDKSAASAAMIRRLAKVYLEKARNSGGGEREIEAIERYFRDINDQIRWVQQARRGAETIHRRAVREFAARAYRRKLTTAESKDLDDFYLSLREQGLTHDEAIQDSLVSVLMSPSFCYRLDLASTGDGRRALTDHELANRLSYFLWSSLPDKRLLSRAEDGTLRNPEVLLSEARRMLADGRVRRLAVEFGGNWLDFRRFQQHNSVDRELYPSFDERLRDAMFQEPVHFFVDVVRQDRSVLSFLYADHTFVNRVLARHYGMPELAPTDDWVRVPNARDFGRGGLLPMSVFLTKNAPGRRTSPVKRGYWVVRRLLGERIPPPPPNVPELPQDEATGELPLRDVLARHREHESCAGCHRRIDSFGLVFEGFGPTGELRDKDLGGRPVEIQAEFPGGQKGHGLPGLRRYLREHRQDEYVENLCRKLLSYALGRSLQLSDEPLIERIRAELAANDHRFGVLVEQIVSSPQFLNKRGRGHLDIK